MKTALKSGSVEWTRQFGEALGKVLKAGDLLALAGELGAGKTELVKGIASGLGCDSSLPVASPTYILLREYPGRLWLYHFDFYRINSVPDLESIGYEEYFDQDGVCVVEWADKFPRIFPKSALWVKLVVMSEQERELGIESQNPEQWEKRLNRAIKTVSGKR